MNFTSARDFILDKLRNGLRPELYYHSIDHTLDVYEAAMRIGRMENLDEHEMNILKTAALMHDAGMIFGYDEHEAASAELARTWLPQFGYEQYEIKQIQEAVMATRLPQQAREKLHQILCDADLDYLGRDDYFLISHKLRLEWIRLRGKQFTLRDWYYLQNDFLQSHHYFRESSQKLRLQGKMDNLQQIKALLGIE